MLLDRLLAHAHDHLLFVVLMAVSLFLCVVGAVWCDRQMKKHLALGDAALQRAQAKYASAMAHLDQPRN